MISIKSYGPSFPVCLCISLEICRFVKCIVCMFSGLITPKLQTSGLTRKGRPFFMTYQTHSVKHYPDTLLGLDKLYMDIPKFAIFQYIVFPCAIPSLFSLYFSLCSFPFSRLLCLYL